MSKVDISKGAPLDTGLAGPAGVQRTIAAPVDHPTIPGSDVTERRQGDRRKVDLGPPPGVPERRRGPRRASDMPKPSCPFCGCSRSSVCRTPRKATPSLDQYNRRRKCSECGRRFPTYEAVDRRRLACELALEGKTLEDLGLAPQSPNPNPKPKEV